MFFTVSSPASKYIAPVNDSKISARRAALLLPPIFSSPLPKKIHLSRFNCNAYFTNVFSHTIDALNFVSSPSAKLGTF